jgi:hypothetical protein
MSGHCCQVEMGCEEIPNPCTCHCLPCAAARMRDEPMTADGRDAKEYDCPVCGRCHVCHYGDFNR